MNLLTDKLSMDDYQLNQARAEILRCLEDGVTKGLQGDFDHTQVIQLRLDGIWSAFIVHPLGYLAERARALIEAAKRHHLGAPYILTDPVRLLAGLTTGEPA